MDNGAEWLSVREAAEAAGVGQGTIRNWIASGRLAAIATDDGLLLVDAADLARLLALRRAAAAAGIKVATLARWAEEAAT